MSLTTGQFQANAISAGFINFQIQAPSKAVYLDRKVDWSMTVNASITVDVSTLPSSLNGDTIVVLTPGRDFSLCAYPLHALTNTMSATICDTAVSSLLAQNRELMDRLTDSAIDREWSTSPVALDVYADNDEAYGSLMNPLAGWDSTTTFGTIGNGAWPITFCNASGAPGQAYTDPAGNVVSFNLQGLPTVSLRSSTNPAPTSVTLYLQFTSSEPLQLSPFIWRDIMERRTGLSQLQNLYVSMTMLTARQAKLFRCTSENQRRVTGYSLWNVNGLPFGQDASLYCQWLSPPMTPELPYQPVNTVDYQQIYNYNFPALVTQTNNLVSTQTLSLNTVPDWIVISCGPDSKYRSSDAAINQGTWWFPIVSVNISWSNVTGLLSNLTQQQLFQISKCNGLKMPYTQWTGKAQTSSASGALSDLAWLTGGPLLLRPGVDITLPPGVTPGQTNAQWTMRVSLTLDTSAVPAYVWSSGLTSETVVLAINSGFFTTSSGTSRIITGPIPGPSNPLQNPEDPNALSGIPSEGPLFRPSGTQLSDTRAVGGRLSMRQRLM